MILGFVWQWLLAIPLKMAHPVSDTPVSLSTYTANIDPASRGSWKTSAWFSESMFAGWPSGKQRCAWRSLPRLNPVNGIHFFPKQIPQNFSHQSLVMPSLPPHTWSLHKQLHHWLSRWGWKRSGGGHPQGCWSVGRLGQTLPDFTFFSMPVVGATMLQPALYLWPVEI